MLCDFFIKNRLFDKAVKNSLCTQKISHYVLNKIIIPSESASKIKAFEPDLTVSILGDEILQKNLIYQLGIINLYTLKLTKYRDLLPTFWALKTKKVKLQQKRVKLQQQCYWLIKGLTPAIYLNKS